MLGVLRVLSVLTVLGVLRVLSALSVWYEYVSGLSVECVQRTE